MTAPLAVSILNRDGATWDATVTEVRALLGGGENPLLFPQHYLVATFPKIGGEIVRFSGDGAIRAFGFLFPRGLCEEGRRVYTLRYHEVVGDERDDGCYGRGGVADVVRHMLDDVGALLGGARVVFYDPARPHRFAPSGHRLANGIDLGSPSEAEALAIREAQAAIWGAAQDGLYPTDLHSVGFGAGTTLVARRGGELVGFLFGFHRFAGSTLPPAWAAQYGGELRLESQLLGVQAAARKGGIGFLLKCAQAEDAREQGVGIVNWTVDPLQFSNAVLNFGRLKALAFDFYPEHYTFRNRLNQVAASRFGMTWLVSSKRVRQALQAERGKAIVDLRGDTTIPRLNRGGDEPHFDVTAPTVAIEIPANWTAVQRDDRDLAVRWRTTTDQLFVHYLGYQPGRYMVTGVGQDDAACFLLAERVTPELLAAYGEPE
jgi:predicted GNAT superfamily acetyltransferase